MIISTESLFNLSSKEITYNAMEEIVKIKTPAHDEGFGLIIKNTDASSDAVVTVKGGNSVMAMGDVNINVAKGTEALVNLKDTGRFKNVHGEDAGYIVLEVSGTDASKVSVFAFAM